MNKTKKQTEGLLLALALGLVLSFSASPVYRSPTSSIPSCNVTRATARIIAVVAMHQVVKTKAPADNDILKQRELKTQISVHAFSLRYRRRVKLPRRTT